MQLTDFTAVFFLKIEHTTLPVTDFICFQCYGVIFNLLFVIWPLDDFICVSVNVHVSLANDLHFVSTCRWKSKHEFAMCIALHFRCLHNSKANIINLSLSSQIWNQTTIDVHQCVCHVKLLTHNWIIFVDAMEWAMQLPCIFSIPLSLCVCLCVCVGDFHRNRF